MKDKKSKIDVYHTLYNVDIIVANSSTTLEQLKKDYLYSDGLELDEEVLGGSATTSTCIRKKDETPCVLVKLNELCIFNNMDKRGSYMNDIAHEALHAALMIYEHAGQDVKFDSQEPLCYLVGYIATCLDKTLQSELK